MKILILGSGAYPLRFQNGLSTSILLPEYGLVLDAGLGLTALPQGYRTEHLHILLSHFHHDHILGLAFLANVLETGVAKQITIWGDERIEHLLAFFKEPFNPDYTSQEMPIDMKYLPEEQTIAGLSIRRKQVPHATGKSNMFVIKEGSSSLVFSTDTTAAESSADFIMGADLLLHECNYDNQNKNRAIHEGHSYPEAIATLAKKAKINKLVLLHTDPRFPKIESEIQSAFPESSVSTDGMEIVV